MVSKVLEPGFQIGKYKVLALIAVGGMGAVYKAMDLELRRTVALKVLPANLAQNGRILDRFRQEARNAARLSHPNIVTLFECGHDPEKDLHFLAMEFIDGIDLAEYIKRRSRLDPEESRVILMQATKALAHAFEQGVVHRDIKPSNLLLARVGPKVVVKLTDMGLARVANDEEFKITRDGTTVGTIDYMAPEQARDSRSADIRSDIYSLGCTAFHMLAGKAPFAEGGLGERLVKHLEVPPPDVRQFNRAVSAGFCDLLLKMLAKKPEDRFATPAELLLALKRLSAEPAIVDPNEETKTTVLELPTQRKTVNAPSPTAPVSPPPSTPEQTRAAALHERAVQVLAEGGGEDYARQLLANCLKIEPFCLAYRQTLREIQHKGSGNTLGRWLGSLNVLTIKSKMHRARSTGKWRKVLEHGEDVLAHQPADVDAHLGLADAADKLDQPHLAIWLLEQGCQQVPNNGDLMRALAGLYEKCRKLKRAIALWEKVVKLEPDDGVGRRKLNDLLAQDHLARGKIRR